MAEKPVISRASGGIQTHEVFRLLVDSVSDYAIFVLDPGGFVASWNPGAERMKGYRPDEIIGKHFSVFYTDPDLATDKPAFELRTAVEVGRFEDEGWRLRKDGSRFWANVIITRLIDDDGDLVGFGKITRDLSERRQAELRYRLLVEGVLDYAIYSMDASGYITSWNLGGERLKGYKPDEIIGKHFSLFYTDGDREAGLPANVLATAAREGHFGGEGWRVRKDGSQFWASVVVTALRDEAGNLYGFSKVTRDVTERQVLHEALERHAAELEIRVLERDRTNAELEAFAYSVSHDLRAPLRAIGGFADALREDCAPNLDQRGQEYLGEITSATARMNALVQDLLDYGRVSRIDMELTPVNLLAVFNEANHSLGEECVGSLKADIPGDVLVQAHPQVLTQVLVNLLSNAFKFHTAGHIPNIQVGARAQNGVIRLEVCDDGVGIAPEHRERIWRVFERLHNREVYPGSGIGLAIVKRGVERMRGTCGMESEVGKGSTFWIELPQAASTIDIRVDRGKNREGKHA